MTLRKLEKRDDGDFVCPECGSPLRFADGGAVSVVRGQLDMENYKPRYICDSCKTYYREMMTTGYYDVFDLHEEDHKPGTKNHKKKTAPTKREKSEAPKPGKPLSTSPIELPRIPTGDERCPVCNRLFRFVEGGAVRVVDGKVDMENTKPKYECDACGVFYREVLTSGFYLPYPQEKEDRLPAVADGEPSAEKEKEGEAEDKQASHHGKGKKKKKKKVVATGDLAPMILRKDENGQCVCPRCGEMMDYVEGQAVRIVDGKPDMENVWDHFTCEGCNSVFRRIVNTDYFQYTEK